MERFLKKLEYVKFIDCIHLIIFIIIIIPASLTKLILKTLKKEIWLICEDRFEARDNGYELFKYIRETYPNKKVYYAIDFKSCDYPKVKKLGNIIKYGSINHWFIYLISEKNISSQKGGKPNAAVCYLLEVYGILRNKRVFLQHGIIMNDCEWLYYKNTKIRLFICGAKPEYDYVKSKFGYPEKNIKYLGLCRFDQLHGISINKKQIVFMPSWRNWIVLKSKNSKKYDDISHFKNTEYYKKIQEFICNKKIIEFLEKNEIDLYFYPHRNMQIYIDNFKTLSNRIKIVSAKDIDIKKLLQESALMITDYSSVSMDFAYMKKPVIYYQFDLEKFREGQYGEGYFSYNIDGFGPVCDNVEQVYNELEVYAKNNFDIKNEDIEKHLKFFPIYDNENCKRNFEAIESLE